MVMLYNQSKLRKMLSDIFGEHFPVKGDQFRIDCLNCDDTTGNLEVNLIKGVFHCWKCDYSGTIRGLLKDYLGYVPKIDRYTSPEDFRKSYDIDSFIKSAPIEAPKRVLDYSILPIDYTFLGQPKENLSMLGRRALKYALSRMTFEDIVHHRIGYCGIGKYKWRLIVPFFEANKAVYFVARNFMGGALRPYDNPMKEEIGVGKEEVIFNIDGARMVSQCVICEGVFDAIRIGIDGVAILGVSISDTQFAKLLNMKKVYVLLDADARWQAIEIAKKFKSFGRQVYLINLAKGDPDNYSREELRNMILTANLFDSLETIFKKEELCTN